MNDSLLHEEKNSSEEIGTVIDNKDDGRHPSSTSVMTEDTPYQNMDNDNSKPIRQLEPEDLLENWDVNEETNLLQTKTNKHYIPYVNGLINEKYVTEHIDRQRYENTKGLIKKEIIIPAMQEDRKKRILELDQKGLELARNNVSCLYNDNKTNVIEDSIKKYGDDVMKLHKMGEEIMSTLNCVGLF